MIEGFISDYFIFVPEFDALLDMNNISEINRLIESKHKYELEVEKNIEDKRIDLFIWQGVLVRKISQAKNMVMNTIMHETYNKFYQRIKSCRNLKELQNLENEIFSVYSDFVIYYSEVTDNYTLNRILKHIHMNIESYISLQDISEDLNLSKPYISLVFKKHMGLTVMDYIMNLKINRAKTFLTTTTQSIMEISQILGFHDSSHFCKTFKKITGVTATEYRKR
ncbi:helix-turn-helix transcriptional regulator [Clostridium sp. YIM B02505]|uniref:Helix-turn-helix transcriptional regulator n=1 Tax=Clostridium yunnanense TaxID=2800325 RepID=A0ABS1ELZ4_9CLOT|nr:helix-turn-helix domain-containing protein [Clostridium yunnanense]MBK1810363.1 helix-turn-helix transcriptional regulator [Clostridium yunnanense]